ncbi:MAG: DNA modification methylase [Methanohalophilus sp.]|jgi:site-specific DNA-methyltransferase (adenine-specific)|nr:MAG: DNA modification methylase [Methanohalophilus sp.]
MVSADNTNKNSSKKSRKKYVPGLARFKFEPKDYWDHGEAQRLYEHRQNILSNQNTIVFEDCVKGMEEMPGNCVDLVVADPPFGLEFSGKQSNYNRDRDLVIDSYHEVKEDYGQFTEKWMNLLYKIMKPQATAYIFSGWTHLEEVLRAARLSGFTTVNHLIWKYQFGVFTKNKYVTSHYHILLLAKDPKKYYFNKMEHYPEDVWDIKRKYRAGEAKNATTLPFEVVKKCIEFSSKPGDIVFDPFMGMATTAAVSKSLWRHYFGFEKNDLLKHSIEKRLNEIDLGQEYIELEERLNEIREVAKVKYPKAYKIYLKEIGENIDDN